MAGVNPHPPYRVGIAGFCHVHVHHVASLFHRHPLARLVACADTPALVPEINQGPYSRVWNRAFLARHFNLPKTYDDYRQMLEHEPLDLVVCNSENHQHPAIVAACAAKGIHVCVEKPMAASLDDARQMIRAAKAAGIKVLIHWYMPFSPLMRRAKALLEEGQIGQILEVKMRAAHAGPLAPGVKHPGPEVETVPLTGPELAATWWYQTAAGGGAMIDFCSYGAMVARWFIGEPAVAAFGLRANLNSPWSEADDNGTIIARFARATGLFEGSWTTRASGVTGGPIVYGTEGTLVVDEWGEQPAVTIMRGSSPATRYEGLPVPEARRTIAEEFFHHLETADPPHPTLDLRFNADAMAILDAAQRSATTGRLEAVTSTVSTL